MLSEIIKTRPNNLEKLYTAVKAIKSTSVEAKHAFSALGYFVSKIKNRLNDDNIDALLFLHHYYSTVNKLCSFYCTIAHFAASSIPKNPGIMQWKSRENPEFGLFNLIPKSHP